MPRERLLVRRNTGCHTDNRCARGDDRAGGEKACGKSTQTHAGDDRRGAPSGDAASSRSSTMAAPAGTTETVINVHTGRNESGDESALQMQAPGEGEHGEDEGTHTSGTDVEPEHKNTNKEDSEECDTDASLQDGPEPPDAKSYTDDIEVGSSTNRRRKSAHGGQLRRDREHREQEVREDKDREVRSERRRMQQTQRESVGKRFEQCAQSGGDERPGYGARQSREKVGGS